MFPLLRQRVAVRIAECLGLIALAGCALEPEGASEERARVDEQGAPYELSIAQRSLPELPDQPTWQDVLHRALLANGELEASYFEWKAAVERIRIASAYPNTNVALGYSYAVSGGRMKGFDRSTFSLGFDSMENLSLPVKVRQRGKIALDEARAAGERFRAGKFDLQQRVLSAFAEFVLLGEKLRIDRERSDLAQLLRESTYARVRAGGEQRDLLAADVALGVADDAVKTTAAELTATRATLNALLARDPDAPLAEPSPVPPPRPFSVSDAALLATAVELNPELAALAHEVAGRTDALELARLQWLPDINPTAVFTDTAEQALGATIVLPTTLMEIRGGIREASAALSSLEATLRQTSRDRNASFVATLVALRNAERQAERFDTQIIPLARQFADVARQSYVAGSATYRDVLDAQRSFLDARLVSAQAHASREKHLAELEALMGTDVETLERSEDNDPAYPMTDSPPTDGETR